MSSPAVVDGVVYIGSDDGKVHALNAVTGAGPRIPASPSPPGAAPTGTGKMTSRRS
nr:PQQ-binding-like beta-propeller repeat protein [Streptomyces durhamensis]